MPLSGYKHHPQPGFQPVQSYTDMKVVRLDSHCRGSTWLLWGSQWFQTCRWGSSTRWPEDCWWQRSAPGQSCPLPSSGNLPTAETQTHTHVQAVCLNPPSFTASRCVGWLNVPNTDTTPSAAAALCTGQWLSGEAADPSPVRRDRVDMMWSAVSFSLSLSLFAFFMDTLTAWAPDLQDFWQLGLVLHHQDVGLTVCRHVMTSLGRVGGVNSSCQTPWKAKMLLSSLQK